MFKVFKYQTTENLNHILPGKEKSATRFLHYYFRVKELKKDAPVSPTPRPLTVPTTTAETDRLESVNKKTSGLPRLEIQVIQVS